MPQDLRHLVVRTGLDHAHRLVDDDGVPRGPVVEVARVDGRVRAVLVTHAGVTLDEIAPCGHWQ